MIFLTGLKKDLWNGLLCDYTMQSASFNSVKITEEYIFDINESPSRYGSEMQHHIGITLIDFWHYSMKF